MNLAQYSIEKNRVVISILVVVLISGAMLFTSLPRDSMPPYTIRVASIVTSFPGASPERVEELVTDKIEKVAQELPELKKVTSTSRTGLSVVQVELRMEIAPNQLQSVWNRLRRKLNSISDLPSGTHPSLQDEGIGEVFGIALALTSDGYPYSEIKETAELIRDEIIRLEDAAKVELNGVQEEVVFVEYDDSRLSTLGLTANIVSSQIGQTNILNTGGKVLNDGELLIIEPTGNFTTVDDISELLIPVNQTGQVVALRDVASVRRGYHTPPSQLVRVNGQPSITLHVSLKDGANVLRLGEGIDEIIEQWRNRLPIGLELDRISSVDYYIDSKVSDFLANLVQAIAIVVVVMVLFLGLRTGLIVASLIPFVTITTFMIMGLFTIGINQISLAALIMALGMMVDNGIVVAESIQGRVRSGMGGAEAAITTCKELFVPLLISTLTTSAAFLSFYLAESVMGDIMGPIFLVISISLLASWVISLSILTFFSSIALKVDSKKKRDASVVDRSLSIMRTAYRRVIEIGLRHKHLTMAGIGSMFILSVFGFTLLQTVFFPDSDRNLVTIDVLLPEGVALERTNSIVRGIEKFMSDSLLVSNDRPEGVVSWASYLGEGPSSYDIGYNADEPNSNYAHVFVNTTSFVVNESVIERLDIHCAELYPDAEIRVSKLSGGGGGTPIEVNISGPSPEVLTTLKDQVRSKLLEIDGTKNIKDDWGPKGKKIVISIDRNRARLAGVTNQDIAVSLQTYLEGFVTGEYREGNSSLPIIMRGDTDDDATIATLESMNVFAQSTGESVPLTQVASIVPRWQFSKVKRVALTRNIKVSSQITSNGNAAQVVAELAPWLETQQESWGDEYSYSLGGEAEESAENMGAVIKYLPLSAIVIIMLLVIQFNSIRKSVIVVSTIPLGVIGMVAGLLAFQVPFGFMAFLGIISLAGIVINNAIVLIDRIQIEQVEVGRNTRDAIVVACLQRFKPIMLATFTTVLGLVPLYLGGGEIWEPMAVTIMVGLLFGTAITLVYVPTLYSILYKVDFKSYKLADLTND